MDRQYKHEKLGRRYLESWVTKSKDSEDVVIGKMLPDHKLLCVLSVVVGELKAIRRELERHRPKKVRPVAAEEHHKKKDIADVKPVSSTKLNINGLSVRARKTIARLGVVDAEHLCLITAEKLLSTKHCGVITAREIMEWATGQLAEQQINKETK